MKNTEFFDIIGEIDEKKLSEAISDRKRLPSWFKWGALAACLCIVVTGGAMILCGGKKSALPDERVVAEGSITGHYSVAVLPATEDIEAVASAEAFVLTEAEVMAQPLAEGLPKTLPRGYRFSQGVVYNTVMENGVEYNMLRVEYTNGEIFRQKFSEDGGAIAPDIDELGEYFSVHVWDFQPDIEMKIVPVEAVTADFLEENFTAYVNSGEYIVGVGMETADAEAVVEVLKSIG